MKPGEKIIENSINRFYRQLENAINEMIEEDRITEKTQAKDILDIARQEQEKHPFCGI